MSASSESGQVRFGDTLLAYEVVRSSRRRKTVEIRVDPVEGIRVAAPAVASSERVADIVRQRAPWILQRLNGHGNRLQTLPPREFVSGESFDYLGRQYRLKVVEIDRLSRAAVRLRGGRFEASVRAGLAPEERSVVVARCLERWYRRHAEAKVKERVTALAERLGTLPSGVLVRDQESRWGSCSPSGVLRFNWRIAMAPLPLVDYIVAHELCHLLHPDHGTAFWRRLATVIPDFELRRQRLRQDGTRYTLTGIRQVRQVAHGRIGPEGG